MTKASVKTYRLWAILDVLLIKTIMCLLSKYKNLLID